MRIVYPRPVSAVSAFFCLALALGLVSAPSAHALQMEFRLASSEPFLVVEVPLSKKNEWKKSLGAMTLSVLAQAAEEGKLTYDAEESGLKKINGIGSAYEIESDAKMKVYGWCYHVDGKEPGVMPDQFMISNSSLPERIEWFYAYADYDSGNWVAMCVPADHIPNEADRN